MAMEILIRVEAIKRDKPHFVHSLIIDVRAEDEEEVCLDRIVDTLHAIDLEFGE
jgi:hypothetical protein